MLEEDSQLGGDALDSLLGELAEEFLQAVERGEHPSLSQYTERYPAIADEIRAVLPALVLLGDSKDDGPRVAATPYVAPRELGDFRIIREIGRGGMGVVFEAEQRSLSRRVALKILPFAAMLDTRQLQRFKNEARAAAALHHSNIVPVHAVGCDQGVHFYAMQLVDGLSLAEVTKTLRRNETYRSAVHQTTSVIKEATDGSTATGRGVNSSDLWANRPKISDATEVGAMPSSAEGDVPKLSTLADYHDDDYFRTIARLGIEAAEALEHAHQCGIIHRDVKPANLLLDHSGKLWLTDLGLAHIETDVGLTRTGDVVGTLCYMSPEQALGRGVVDQRTDVYSLGATLYELATLQPAFPSSDRTELLNKLAFQAPARPRNVNRRVPGDLDTIICKSIEREPADRYPSARMLADDLRRFVENKPIHARPAGPIEKLTKWSRRHVGIVWTLLAAAVLVGGLLAVSTGMIARALQEAALNERRLSESLYAADIRLAAQAWQENDPLRAVQLLDRHVPTAGTRDYRDLEWHFLRSQFNAPHRELADTGSPIHDFTLSPSERLLALVGKDGVLHVHEWPSMERVARIDAGQGELNSVAFSADEATVATVGDNGELRLWRNFKGPANRAIKAHAEIAYGVLYAPLLRCWITCGDDARIRMFDDETGASNGELKGHTGGVNAIVLSHDGNRLASASNDHTVRLWDLRSKKELGDVSERAQGRTARLAFDAKDEALLLGRVSSHYGSSLVMTHLQPHRTTPLPLSTHRVEGVAISPDRLTVAAASDGGVALTLTLDSSEMASEPKLGRTWQACLGSLYKMAFTADGSLLLTAGADGRLRAWSELGARSISARYRPLPGVGWIDRVGSKPLVVVAANDNIGVVDVRTGELVTKIADGAFASIDASADGSLIAACTDDSEVFVWSFSEGGCELVTRYQCQSVIRQVQISPDNKTLALWAASAEGGLRFLDLQSLHERASGIQGGCVGFQWSPDGNYYVAGERGESNDVVVVDSHTGRVRWRCDRHQTTIGAIAVSFDGKLIASADENRTIILRNAQSGAEVWRTTTTTNTTKSGSQKFPTAMQFSSLGRTLLVVDSSGHLTAWHVATGRELLRLTDGDAGCLSMTISGDGRYICVAKGELSVIDAAPQ